MHIEKFLSYLNVEFYSGVPDSQLKALCDYLMEKYGVSDKHIIAANEGNATAMAAGYYLATGKIPAVYMQNSGIGNMINPTASLLHKKVYGIPCIFIVGWRGEPQVYDEPQHIFQGEVTIKLLEDMGIKTFIVGQDTSENEIAKVMLEFEKILKNGDSVSFIIRKNALINENKVLYDNKYSIIREDAIECIINAVKDDIIISTTGKASRELFEIREKNKQSHEKDFLTVGSMGHCSSIALSVALQKKHKKVWCIDGDGAAIMHMGAMAIIGDRKPSNLIHILIDNCSHETVGGMPTVSDSINWENIAFGFGYQKVFIVNDLKELKEALNVVVQTNGLTFIIIRCSTGSRKDLGRPTIKAEENKNNFMNYICKS